MKKIHIIITACLTYNICLAQPSLTIWINSDGYHQDHNHAEQTQYFCDSSYYLFYHNNSDTVFVTLKNEGTEPLDLVSASTLSIAGSSFEVIDFVPRQLLPGEMYSLKLGYQLPDSYINGINGQLMISSNDPDRSTCVLFFEVGCEAVWNSSVGEEMGVDGSCRSPVIWVEDFGSLSDPNMVYDDSMNFYTYEAGFQAIKTMKLDHKGGVIMPNYLTVFERLEAGSRAGDFSNFRADSNSVLIRKELNVEGNANIDDTLDVDKALFVGQSLNVSQDVKVAGTLEVQAMTSPSDRRLKQQISPLADALTTVMMLQPKSYYLKDKESTEKPQYGFIAQELADVLPMLVHTNHDDLKSVNYLQLIPWLTAALQEQQQTIDRLEKRLVQLENK